MSSALLYTNLETELFGFAGLTLSQIQRSAARRLLARTLNWPEFFVRNFQTLQAAR